MLNESRIISFTSVVCCLFLTISSVAQNIDLIAHIPLSEDGNDIWGYVDKNGIEYAVIGSAVATYIYSLEDPFKPVFREKIIGANGLWRDIKSYGNYIYVVADQGADGLLVINMSHAPNIVDHSFFKPKDIFIGEDSGSLEKCHNLFIDKKGIAYLSGCNLGNGGILIYDLNASPEDPELIGIENREYSHDVFVRNDTMFTSEIFIGSFGVYDISDPTNPVLLASQNTGTNFTHNTWLSDDGNILYTTDERPNAFVEAYDISDLMDIHFLGKYQPIVGKGVVPHNVHFLDNFLYVSWYSQGSIILDATDPTNIVKIGQFKNGPETNHWGAYPFLPSGLLLASDINNGLYVLKPNIQRASYIEGLIISSSDQSLINGARIEILSGNGDYVTSNLNGVYKTGNDKPGSYLIKVSHPSYFDIIEEIELVSGKVIKMDVKLEPKRTFSLSGNVIKKNGEIGLEGAQILVQNKFFNYNAISDEIGYFEIEMFEGQYDIFIGSWGYLEKSINLFDLESNATVVIDLEEGYQDGFVLDQGWRAGGGALKGGWVRGIPVPTSARGAFVNAPYDIDGDNGSFCLITGNEGGGAGTDDVDGGETYIESPSMDLTEYIDPVLKYSVYFFNGGGNSVPNDYMKVRISNQEEFIYLDILEGSNASASDWKVERSFKLKDYLNITNEMQLRVEVGDVSPGHLVEGAFDGFSVFEGNTTSLIDDLTDINLMIFPNPAKDFLNLVIIDGKQTDYRLQVYSQIGKICVDKDLKSNKMSINVSGFSSGVYFVKISDDSGKYQIEKLSIIK